MITNVRNVKGYGMTILFSFSIVQLINQIQALAPLTYYLLFISELL